MGGGGVAPGIVTVAGDGNGGVGGGGGGGGVMSEKVEGSKEGGKEGSVERPFQI